MTGLLSSAAREFRSKSWLNDYFYALLIRLLVGFDVTFAEVRLSFGMIASELLNKRFFSPSLSFR